MLLGQVESLFFGVAPLSAVYPMQEKTARVGDFRLPSQHVQLANVTQV